MTHKQGWEAYQSSYRAAEMKTLAGWIAAGESGSIVGLPGCGRSNLLGFLWQQPELLHNYSEHINEATILLLVDLVNLPGATLANLYRTLLNAFYRERERFPIEVAASISTHYLDHRAERDPFLTQQALYDVLLACRNANLRIVLILSRFDRFVVEAKPLLVNSLRSLRDYFRSTLSIIASLQREARYLPEPATLGDMHELLDNHVCWVGALSADDARFMLAAELRTAHEAPSPTDCTAILAITGCFPSLLRAVSQWWLATAQRPTSILDLCSALLRQDSVTYRLARIWGGLTQEEKLILSQIQTHHLMALPNQTPHTNHLLLNRLQAKGVCEQINAHWRIKGDLLAAYVGKLEGQVRGRIWVNETTRIIYQDRQPLDAITNGLEYEILCFLIRNPGAKLSRDKIIDNAWPEADQREGIAPNALQVHIANIRKKIEQNPAEPRYLVTWHGRPGGYQFFPEGRPE